MPLLQKSQFRTCIGDIAIMRPLAVPSYIAQTPSNFRMMRKKSDKWTSTTLYDMFSKVWWQSILMALVSKCCHRQSVMWKPPKTPSVASDMEHSLFISYAVHVCEDRPCHFAWQRHWKLSTWGDMGRVRSQKSNITHRPHCKANSIFYGIFNKTTKHGAMKTKKSVYIIVFAGFKLPTPYILVLCHTIGNCGIWYICAYSRGPQGFERKSQPIPAAIAMSK